MNGLPATRPQSAAAFRLLRAALKAASALSFFLPVRGVRYIRNGFFFFVISHFESLGKHCKIIILM